MRSGCIHCGFLVVVCAASAQSQLPPASQPSTASALVRPITDRQLRRDMYSLENKLADGRLREAIELRHGLRVREADLPAAFQEYLKRLDRDLAAEIKKREASEGDGYFLIRNSDTGTSEWAEVLSEARDRLREIRNKDLRKGLAIVWIHLEKPDRERRIDLEHNLPCWKSQQWMGDTFQPRFSGRDSHVFLILSKEGEAANQTASLTIKPMQHVPVSMNLPIPDKGVRCSEVYLKLMGRDRLGQLRCHFVPEPGITLENVSVLVLDLRDGYVDGQPLHSDGTCLIEALPPGTYKVSAVRMNELSSSIERYQIEPGHTTEVNLTVYARRRVTLEWLYRPIPGQGKWEEGSTQIRTGEWPPREMLGKNQGLFRVANWGSPGPLIELYYPAVRARVLTAEPEDFEKKRIRFTEAQFMNAPRDRLPLEVGGVIALRYDRPGEQQEAEALIRIKSIEPVLRVSSAPSSSTHR